MTSYPNRGLQMLDIHLSLLNQHLIRKKAVTDSRNLTVKTDADKLCPQKCVPSIVLHVDSTCNTVEEGLDSWYLLFCQAHQMRT